MVRFCKNQWLEHLCPAEKYENSERNFLDVSFPLPYSKLICALLSVSQASKSFFIIYLYSSSFNPLPTCMRDIVYRRDVRGAAAEDLGRCKFPVYRFIQIPICLIICSFVHLRPEDNAFTGEFCLWQPTEAFPPDKPTVLSHRVYVVYKNLDDSGLTLFSL